MDLFRKIFYRLIFLGLALALAGPFLMKHEGEPLMSLSDFKPSFGSGTAELSAASGSSSISSSSSFGEQQFYKWKDKNGVWQFTQEPPPEEASAEVVSVNPNANIIQSMSQKEINTTLGFDSKTFGQEGKEGPAVDVNIPDLSKLPFPLPTSLPGADIEKLMEDAKALQQLSQDRMKMLNNIEG